MSDSEFEKRFISQAAIEGKTTIISFLKSVNISRNIATAILQKSKTSPLKPIA
ncbi:MAG: hypothetical protein K0B15_00910 [Lentimicrobium sp.]|nr:hypothetical protein [Lentimicrobium sp.]